MERALKKPKAPPDFPALYHAATEAGTLLSIFQKVSSVSPRGTYFPWDEVRFRPPPDSLTAEQHWLGLKLRRQSQYSAIPLQDKSGSPFQYLVPEHVAEALHRIDLQAGGNLSVLPLTLSEAGRDQYLVTSLMEEAITSSQLEGATTTRPVAREMLRTDRKPKDRSERMILNNFLTMQRIRELRDQPLTEDLLFELHRRVTDGTLDDPSAAGRLRTAEERINVSDDFGEIYHDPPAAAELPERLGQMLAFANDNTNAPFIHPALRAIMLHFWLAYDHPFVDGNGRTARALFYWSMLRSGYWLFEYISISQIILKAPAQYSRAFLHSETDDNDLTFFIDYHIGVINKGLDALQRYVQRKQREQREMDALLRNAPILNYRQRAILSHALRHAGHQYTVEAHSFSQDVSTQTARNDLKRLAHLGLMRIFRRGNADVFVPEENIETKLAQLSEKLSDHK